MKVELFPFQKKALADIRMKTAEAMGSYHRTHAPQVVSFTAPTGAGYNGPPVKTTHEIIIVNQIIPYQPILSPEPPCYRSAQRNCPAEQGCLDRLGLAGTMALARCPQLLNPLRTLAAAAQPARTRLSRSMACDAKQLW